MNPIHVPVPALALGGTLPGRQEAHGIDSWLVASTYWSAYYTFAIWVSGPLVTALHLEAGPESTN